MSHHPGLCVDEASGLEKVKLRTENGWTAEVFLHGGHLTSWKTDQGHDIIFTSSKAVLKPPKAIRGGIPICFPQFAKFGSLDQHGFARNRVWTLDPSSSSAHTPSSVTLLLVPSAEDLQLWPHSFELRVRHQISPTGILSTSLMVKNTDSKAMTFTTALHTYFTVSDISEVRIEGLETMDYLDNLNGQSRGTDQGDSITFDAEFDRIYLHTPNRIAVVDHQLKKTIIVNKANLPDTVVWNPWEKKAKSMSDFGDEEFKTMVCVEAGAIEHPVSVKPGEEWTAGQELSLVGSSSASGKLDADQVLASMKM